MLRFQINSQKFKDFSMNNECKWGDFALGHEDDFQDFSHF